jgi:hypothetical protein
MATSEEVPDAAQPVQVVGAVTARAAGGAGGVDQTPRLVQAQRLHTHVDPLGGHGDSEHAAIGRR